MAPGPASGESRGSNKPPKSEAFISERDRGLTAEEDTSFCPKELIDKTEDNSSMEGGREGGEESNEETEEGMVEEETEEGGSSDTEGRVSTEREDGEEEEGS